MSPRAMREELREARENRGAAVAVAAWSAEARARRCGAVHRQSARTSTSWWTRTHRTRRISRRRSGSRASSPWPSSASARSRWMRRAIGRALAGVKEQLEAIRALKTQLTSVANVDQGGRGRPGGDARGHPRPRGRGRGGAQGDQGRRLKVRDPPQDPSCSRRGCGADAAAWHSYCTPDPTLDWCRQDLWAILTRSTGSDPVWQPAKAHRAPGVRHLALGDCMRRATRLAAVALLVAARRQHRRLPACGRRLAAPAIGRRGCTGRQGAAPAEGRYIVILKDGKSVDTATERAGKGSASRRTRPSAMRSTATRRSSRRRQLATLRGDPDVEAVVPDDGICDRRAVHPHRRPPCQRPRKPDRAASTAPTTAWTRTSRSWTPGSVAGRPLARGPQHRGGIQLLPPTNLDSWGDANGHGTHVAGTVGALDNGIGVVGRRPRRAAVGGQDPRLGRRGLISWYVCGLDWIAAQRDPDDPTRPLFEAVNMSVAKSRHRRPQLRPLEQGPDAPGDLPAGRLGRHGRRRGGQQQLQRREPQPGKLQRGHHGLRTGGHGRNGRAPSAATLCYSWGSYDKDDTFADFTNYGADVDLIAPASASGRRCRATATATSSGTSMAAPARDRRGRPVQGLAPARDARPRSKAALQAAGTLDWKTSTDPDAIHEPLLDVSQLVAARRLQRRCRPGSSALVERRRGGAVTVPVKLIRAEDFTGRGRRSRSTADGATRADARSVATPRPGGTVDTTIVDHGPAGTPERARTRSSSRADDGTRQRTGRRSAVGRRHRPAGRRRPALAPRTGTTFDTTSFAARGAGPRHRRDERPSPATRRSWRVDGGTWSRRGALSPPRTLARPRR